MRSLLVGEAGCKKNGLSAPITHSKKHPNFAREDTIAQPSGRDKPSPHAVHSLAFSSSYSYCNYVYIGTVDTMLGLTTITAISKEKILWDTHTRTHSHTDQLKYHTMLYTARIYN